MKDFHEAIKLSQYYIEQYPEEYKFAELANRAIRKKTNTLREVFSKVIDDYSTLYFVTFTFSDKALSKTQESTKRKKLKEVLEALVPTLFVSVSVQDIKENIITRLSPLMR